MTEIGKSLVDIGAGATAIATLASWLPPIAALFTIIWTGIRIYEWLRGKGVE